MTIEAEVLEEVKTSEEQPKIKRVDLGNGMVIEVLVKPAIVVEKPQLPTKEQANARSREMVAALRKAARCGISIRKWQARIKLLQIKEWLPFVEAVSEIYSDTQKKFQRNGVEVTLTETHTETIEPVDIINAIGIEKALVLGLLVTDIAAVRAAAKTKMLDMKAVDPLIHKAPHTSMSIRLVPKASR